MAATETGWETVAGTEQPRWPGPGWQWQQREVATFGICAGKSCQDLFLDQMWRVREGEKSRVMLKEDAFFPLYLASARKHI